MNMKKIAIQGVKGCFHEQAARLFYEEHGHIVPDIVECLTFDDLYRSMEGGEADAAIMAIENTVSGGLLPNFELLRKYDRKIKGEVFLRIQQNLMAMPGQTIQDLKEVRTHYMAINQTREFFKEDLPRENYGIYKIGSLEDLKTTYDSLFVPYELGVFTINISGLTSVFPMDACDVYVSMRYEGPAYGGSCDDDNAVYIDRVIVHRKR